MIKLAKVMRLINRITFYLILELVSCYLYLLLVQPAIMKINTHTISIGMVQYFSNLGSPELVYFPGLPNFEWSLAQTKLHCKGSQFPFSFMNAALFFCIINSGLCSKSTHHGGCSKAVIRRQIHKNTTLVFLRYFQIIRQYLADIVSIALLFSFIPLSI